MPGESYFLAFGGLGLALAGFAGLIATMNPSGAAGAVGSYRIRTIVFLGIWLTVVGFATVALFAVTDDVRLTVRAASLLMLVAYLRGLVIDARPGPVWRTESERRATMAALVVLLAVTAGNVVVGSVAYLEVILLLGLLGPVSIFYNTIRDATGGSPVERG
jgi:hypothetical protein